MKRNLYNYLIVKNPYKQFINNLHNRFFFLFFVLFQYSSGSCYVNSDTFAMGMVKYDRMNELMKRCSNLDIDTYILGHKEWHVLKSMTCEELEILSKKTLPKDIIIFTIVLFSGVIFVYLMYHALLHEMKSK